MVLPKKISKGWPHPQLGLPFPLFQRISVLQEQQTERKLREWLRPQEKLRSKVDSRYPKSEIRTLCSLLFVKGTSDG